MNRNIVSALVILLTTHCLIEIAVPSWRIVNGTDAASAKIPYIVSLRWDGEHICGASIIDETHILTAAHCIPYEDLPANRFSIQYGVTEITYGYQAPNMIRVASYTRHPNYTVGYEVGYGYIGYPNDVAVVKLVERIVFSDAVKPIVLPEANEATPAGCNATLAGWGFPYSHGRTMKHLQVVNLLVYSDEDCEAAYADEDVKTERRYHICSGVPEGGKGQCSGDSGGPLQCDGKQIGVVSWSKKPCAREGFPGVFTKVSTQVPWIHDNV